MKLVVLNGLYLVLDDTALARCSSPHIVETGMV